MPEQPFREEDVLWRWTPTISVRHGGSEVKELCFVQESDFARKWIRTQNRWIKEYRVETWWFALLCKLRESHARIAELEKEEVKAMTDTLNKKICGNCELFRPRIDPGTGHVFKLYGECTFSPVWPELPMCYDVVCESPWPAKRLVWPGRHADTCKFFKMKEAKP